MEARPDAAICNFVGKGCQVGKAVGYARCRRLVIAISGMSSVPSAALITPETLPLRMQCAHGYSGCIGVLSIGCQVASRSVAGLPSISPLRIAVIGRQKL